MSYSNQAIMTVEWFKGDVTELSVSPFVNAALSEKVYSSLEDIMVAITNESGYYRINLQLAVSVADK